MKERKSNFELMRIVSMILIIMWHLILHSGIYNTNGTQKLFLDFILLFCIVHINSFVLLTGYFQCKKEFSVKKFINTFNVTWFYKAIFAIIFFIAIPKTLSKLVLFKEIMPIDCKDYWYVNCYLAMYLLSPFFNKLIHSMNQREHKKLLIICFVLYSIIPLITNQGTISNTGYTISQLCMMYFFGAYFRMYPIEKDGYFKNCSHNKRQLTFLILWLTFFLINFMTLCFSKVLLKTDSIFIREIGGYLSNNNQIYSNPIIIFQSIFYFLYFSTLKIKSKFINKISVCVFDVYLIHENYYLWNKLYIWLGVMNFLKLNAYTMCMLIVVYSIMIFSVCIIIGNIRKIIFDFISNRKIVKKINIAVSNYVKEL